MTDFDYDEGPDSAGEPGAAADMRGAAVRRAVNLSGGVASLVLMGGLAVWGYQLLMRDVTGVPVVRALEGPIRVTPEDPGGDRAEYQGLAVNEIAAVGTAGGPEPQVTLAPAPPELAEEDKPIVRLVEKPAEADAAASPDQTGPDTAGAAPAEAAPVEDTSQDALVERAVAEALGTLPESTGDARAGALAMADTLAEGVEPLSEAGTPPEDVSQQVDVSGKAATFVPRSPRPRLRPASLEITVPAENASITAVEPVSASIPDEEIAISDLPAGTRLVQLGAFASAEVAREQWVEIGGRFEDFFAGKRRVIQKAESGGKTFYRLRAEGFTDLADARRFCSALAAGDAACIPVALR